MSEVTESKTPINLFYGKSSRRRKPDVIIGPDGVPIYRRIHSCEFMNELTEYWTLHSPSVSPPGVSQSQNSAFFNLVGFLNLHRVDGGPAVQTFALRSGPDVKDGELVAKEWYSHGILHRTDGPAKMVRSPEEEPAFLGGYYLMGKYMDKEQFTEEIKAFKKSEQP